MCLVPGMLERAPARPSERAGRFALAMSLVLGAFTVFSLALIVSYSIWSVVQNLLFALYAFVVLRPFRNDDPLVFVENIACFSIISALNCILAVFNLVNLATEKQALYEKLADWQIITGLVMSGLCVACFLLLSVLSIVLFRDLRETVLLVDEESSPFIPGSGFPSQREGGLSFGSFGYPPTGSYVQTQSRTTAQQQQTVERFPGKGYKLNS